MTPPEDVTSKEYDVCSYNPPAPPQGTNLVANYPSHTFPSVGSGSVEVKFRYSSTYNSQDWAEQKKINLDASMEPLLDSFANNMSYFSRLYGNNGYGNISWIGHIGGAPGTRRYTYHNVGRALDVTWIQWTGGNASNPQVAESEVFDSNGHWRPTTHRRLVAVEAGLRKWFGYVLNRYIGCILPPTECNGEPLEGPRSSHHNHFHVDNGCPVALRVDRESRIRLDRTIRSCHYFIQDCINAFTDVDVDYDGTWDAQTDRAYEHLLSDLGMECLNPIKFINHYMLFLDYIMMHGFADKPAGTFRWGDKAIL